MAITADEAREKILEQNEDVVITKVVEFNHPIHNMTVECFAIHCEDGKIFIVRGDSGVVFEPHQFWRAYSGFGTMIIHPDEFDLG